MPFFITGILPDKVRTATRSGAASAIVLAIKWDGEGVTDIIITPPEGGPRDFRTFQTQHYGLVRPA